MPPRRFRSRLPLLIALTSLLVGLVVYVVGLATLQARADPLLVPSDLFIPRMIDEVIFLWCAWMGMSVGSFLNVVAWRMPRGLSINGRSHCPRCQTQLSARDNFPVFGWLALGGRCRTCHLPISPRYPIVEAVVGVTITAVAICGLFRLNLPRQITWHRGPLWTPAVSAPVLLTLLYHIVGLSLSWGVGLIRMDGNKLPDRLVTFAAAVVVLPMLAYPTLMVVPWQMNVTEPWKPDGLYIDAMVRLLTALAAATVLARYLARGLCPMADPKLDPLGKSTARLMDLVVILSIPIVLVGWQASPALVVLASMIAIPLRRFVPAGCDALGRFAIAMPLALTIQMVFWRQLHAYSLDPDAAHSWWPSDGGSQWVFLSWSAAVILVPLWTNDRPDSPAEHPSQPNRSAVEDEYDDDQEDASGISSEDS